MLHTLTPTTPAAAAISGTTLSVTTGVAGAALLLLGAWMIWRKKSKKIIMWLFFVAGFLLGGGLATTLTGMFTQVGGAGATAFGIGVTAFVSIIGLILLFELWHHRKSPNNFHPYLALATPMLIIAGGGGLLHGLFVWFAGLLGHVSGPVSALFGG